MSWPGGGKAIFENTEGSLVYSPKKLVALVGIKDLIIVETKDALLICKKRLLPGCKKSSRGSGRKKAKEISIMPLYTISISKDKRRQGGGSAGVLLIRWGSRRRCQQSLAEESDLVWHYFKYTGSPLTTNFPLLSSSTIMFRVVFFIIKGNDQQIMPLIFRVFSRHQLFSG